MTRRLDKHGKRFHTPEDRVSDWAIRKEAELDTSFRMPMSYLIVTRDELDSPNAEIRITSSGIRRKSPTDHRRFSIDWLLQNYRGVDDSLMMAVGSMTHVFGYKPSGNSQLEAEPVAHRDLIFLNGETAITPADDEERVVKLGKVVGLTIVTNQLNYPVWVTEPSQDSYK